MPAQIDIFGGEHDLSKRPVDPNAPMTRAQIEILRLAARPEGVRPVEAGTNAIRVTEAEAATLQSFPDDYPWEEAGTRSAAFRCIGNAVPPLMARAVLEAVLR